MKGPRINLGSCREGADNGTQSPRNVIITTLPLWGLSFRYWRITSSYILHTYTGDRLICPESNHMGAVFGGLQIYHSLFFSYLMLHVNLRFWESIQ